MRTTRWRQASAGARRNKTTDKTQEPSRATASAYGVNRPRCEYRMRYATYKTPTSGPQPRNVSLDAAVHVDVWRGVPYSVQLWARFTPSSVIPVGHSSEATSLNSAILCPTPTPHPSDPDPATYMVALSALRRVQPYRWRPQSPNTALSALDTVSQRRQLGSRRRR